MIQHQILRTSIIRIVWKTVGRITNEILGVKELRTDFKWPTYLHQKCAALTWRAIPKSKFCWILRIAGISITMCIYGKDSPRRTQVYHQLSLFFCRNPGLPRRNVESSLPRCMVYKIATCRLCDLIIGNLSIAHTKGMEAFLITKKKKRCCKFTSKNERIQLKCELPRKRNLKPALRPCWRKIALAVHVNDLL